MIVVYDIVLYEQRQINNGYYSRTPTLTRQVKRNAAYLFRSGSSTFSVVPSYVAFSGSNNIALVIVSVRVCIWGWSLRYWCWYWCGLNARLEFVRTWEILWIFLLMYYWITELTFITPTDDSWKVNIDCYPVNYL